jgi:hypothetical protein
LCLERDIRDVIKVFRVFSPFYSYKSKYLISKADGKNKPGGLQLHKERSMLN